MVIHIWRMNKKIRSVISSCPQSRNHRPTHPICSVHTFCLQEVVGSAIALALLSRGAIPLWAGALLSAAASFLLLLTERAGIRKLEALFLAMIGVMVATFGFMWVCKGWVGAWEMCSALCMGVGALAMTGVVLGFTLLPVCSAYSCWLHALRPEPCAHPHAAPVQVCQGQGACQ